MKNLATSIMLILGVAPLTASAYQLTVNVDGGAEVHTVESATFSSDVNGALLTVTGLDTGGGGSGPYAPVFTSGNFSKQENSGTTVGTVTATDQDGDDVTFVLGGGVDDSEFSLSTAGALTFKAVPDYEDPTDNGFNNVYNITVTATDSSGTNESTNKSISVTVTDDTSDNGSGGGGSCGALPANVVLSNAINLGTLSSQVQVTLRQETVAMAFTTTSNSGYSGKFSIASTTGNSGVTRQVWVSECPGTPFNAESLVCAKTGTSSTIVRWDQGTAASYECGLQTNKDYYLNVRNVNCSSRCDIYRNIYTNGNP